MEKITREKLNKIISAGPCNCSKADCWYCSSTGDFKFSLLCSGYERDIWIDRVNRALEIANALAATVKKSITNDKHTAKLKALVSQVEEDRKKMDLEPIKINE